MSGPSNVKELPLTDKSQLVEFHASGGRPRERWTIGTEHEKFGFRLDDLRPPTYEGERGIEAMLRGLTRFGWQPFEEKGKVIALLRDGASITLLQNHNGYHTNNHNYLFRSSDIYWQPSCANNDHLGYLHIPDIPQLAFS